MKKYHYLPLLDDRNTSTQGIDANGVQIANGNLYGSSKDMGSIPGKFPTLTEFGGRVNRVGFTRIDIEGTLEKFGFFDEYTEESMMFDSDSELMMHINREMIYGAHEITEDALQIDLLNNAGVIVYPGAAISKDTVDKTPITYRELLKLHLLLSNNRCPLQTMYLSGTRNIDTMTIPSSRVMFVGHELQCMIEEMVDLHGERAFIPVQKYAAGTKLMNGEIGSVGYFRIIVVPEMTHDLGAGGPADAAGLVTHYNDGTNYTLFPMLVVGAESFSTIGFQTDGNTVKFRIFHCPPGKEEADRFDPYGETGFMSIKWYYGFLLLRPERLAVVWTAGGQ